MTQAYWAGYNDAINNLSKAYKIKDYELGYADGLVDRENSNPNKAHSRQVAECNRPAYYDQEGGSMCNGIGRDYF